MTVPTGQRLAALRALMKQNKVNMYIVPSEDAHSSEYVAECDARRAFISGFDGSAGVAVVTESDANLFTDGRYFNQASHQLDSNWTLMKQGKHPVRVDWGAKMRLRSAGSASVAGICGEQGPEGKVGHWH